MNEPHIETIHENTFSCAIIDGTWLHDSRKGYGTLSEDRKSVTWATWHPPTPEEIAEHEKMLARARDPEFSARMRADQEQLYARFGMTQERLAKTLSDAIEDAP